LFPAILYENIKVADERDIAAMKLAAIAGRGSKRDFVDVYFLLKKYSLAQLFSFFTEKFKEIPYSRLHLLKSLTYFKDAEDEPMPELTATVSWEEIKESLTKQTIKLLKEQLSKES
jgi:predicted nucleotidyltransferase component of viral defense system